MRKLFFCLLCLVSCLTWAAPQDSIKVFVINEKDQPIPNQKVSIDKGPVKTTNKKGSFSFIPVKKFDLPFDVDLYSEEYLIEDYEYLENERAIYITLAKSKVQSFKVLVQDVDKNILGKYSFQYKNKTFTTDAQGNAVVLGKNPVVTDFKTEQKALSIIKKDNKYILTLENKVVIAKIPKQEAEPTNVDIPTPTQDTIATEVVKTKFEEYSEEFSVIEKELEFERNQIDQVDLKLRKQLEAITNKLKNEKGLSDKERNDLLKYEAKLHKDLEDNIAQFNQSKARIFEMMDAMRYSLLKKDSVNKIMEAKLKAEQEKRIVVEMQAKRQALIYIIIIITILILALVFYGIARKIRSQKTELSKSNQLIEANLIGMKDKWTGLKYSSLDFYLWLKKQGINVQIDYFIDNIIDKQVVNIKMLAPIGLNLDLTSKWDNKVSLDLEIMQKFWIEIASIFQITDWSNQSAEIEVNESKITLKVAIKNVGNSYLDNARVIADFNAIEIGQSGDILSLTVDKVL